MIFNIIDPYRTIGSILNSPNYTNLQRFFFFTSSSIPRFKRSLHNVSHKNHWQKYEEEKHSTRYHVYITDGINMKSEHRVYTHRRVYILSAYRSQSGGFRHTGETASILKAIWTPVSRGTRKRIPLSEILPQISIIETHYSRA